MAERKIDYFGTFLESMKSSQRPPETSDPGASRSFETSSPAAKRSPDRPEALDAMLKALRGGPLSAKDLIPFTGNSASEFLNVRERLVALGWARLRDGDALELTPEGQEVARLLA
jgi:hypothetical protein